MPTITLTTDFGTGDWFVGSMKGVILGLEPRAAIVDITHEIPAGDIRAGALALMMSYRCFVRQTVHVAVVDPGVGSDRAAIAVKTQDYWFVGPDNGVLSLALMGETIVEVRRLENESYFRRPVSNTFHGRDIFAPVAARLTQAILVDSLGPAMKDYVRLRWPKTKFELGAVFGEVVYIDRFGNAITNIDFPSLTKLGKRAWKIAVNRQDIGPMRNAYHEVAEGVPVAVLGSTGYLEIAIRAGHAARQLNIKIGDPVEVR